MIQITYTLLDKYYVVIRIYYVTLNLHSISRLCITTKLHYIHFASVWKTSSVFLELALLIFVIFADANSLHRRLFIYKTLTNFGYASLAASRTCPSAHFGNCRFIEGLIASANGAPGIHVEKNDPEAAISDIRRYQRVPCKHVIVKKKLYYRKP